METQFSKQDKAIEEGVQSLREMPVDTSNMSRVLNPRPRRSVMLPVGLATAAACAIGAVALMAPAKATASPFDKVKEAVLRQATVHQKTFDQDETGTWVLQMEAFKDEEKLGVKVGPQSGEFQLFMWDGKKYVKSPDSEVKVSLITTEAMDPLLQSPVIHEILARDGMQFLGIQRSQSKDGRFCDIYRLNYKGEPNDQFFYVDPKTDLPFLQEVVDKNGRVLNKVEIEFGAEIHITFRIEGDRVVPVYIVKGLEKEQSKADGPITILTPDSTKKQSK